MSQNKAGEFESNASLLENIPQKKLKFTHFI